MAEPESSFADLGLPEPLLRALANVGYETPTPIQARTVPPLLAGRDVLGHAPTGTGKTAAFALPILARLDVERKGVQALVLTPTRELAIQVAEAFTRYASASPRLRVLPVYGGQDYTGQLKALARGVQVVVGTPGRVTDHVKRGTLKLDTLSTLVLDEADEMLRMGFVDEVEWLLEQTPPARQTALFSATMPPPIRRIAKRHLNDPEEIGIEKGRSAATTIRQRVWMVGGGMDKLEALTRILEVEPFEAMLVFVRTKSATLELAEKLEARGFAAQAMNGDMPQKERERQVDKLRGGRLDILVATDVVARGLDVERISHVVNYDIPYDTEAYVHRIGRTGRAGRSGEAILFVVPRERRLLGAIENATRQKIEPLALPSVEQVNERRVEAFEAGIDEVLEAGDLGFLERLVERYAEQRELPMSRVAAALARLAIGERPLLLEERPAKRHKKKERREEARDAARREGEPSPAPPAGSRPPARPPAGTASTSPPAPAGRREGAPAGSPASAAAHVASPDVGTATPTAASRAAVATAPADATSSETASVEATPDAMATAASADTTSTDVVSNETTAPTPTDGIPEQAAATVPADETSSETAAPADATAPGESTEPAGKTPSEATSRPDAAFHRPAPPASGPTIVMERFRVEVGREHGVETADLVGAIASEADIRAEFIGRVDVQGDHSLVELPEGMPKFMLKELRRVWVRGRQLDISRLGGEGGGPRTPSAGKGPGKPPGATAGGKRAGSRHRPGTDGKAHRTAKPAAHKGAAKAPRKTSSGPGAGRSDARTERPSGGPPNRPSGAPADRRGGKPSGPPKGKGRSDGAASKGSAHRNKPDRKGG